MYGESNDITGGMGLVGVVEFEKFVERGRRADHARAPPVSSPPISASPATVDAGAHHAAFYAPGPIVEAEILRPTHPIFYGYTEKMVPVRWANGPLLRVPQRRPQAWILMRFPGTDASVLSGLMKGVAETRNRPAIRRCAGGARPRGDVRHQSLLPLAEPRRIQHACKLHSALQRLSQAGINANQFIRPLQNWNRSIELAYGRPHESRLSFCAACQKSERPNHSRTLRLASPNRKRPWNRPSNNAWLSRPPTRHRRSKPPDTDKPEPRDTLAHHPDPPRPLQRNALQPAREFQRPSSTR